MNQSPRPSRTGPAPRGDTRGDTRGGARDPAPQASGTQGPASRGLTRGDSPRAGGARRRGERRGPASRPGPYLLILVGAGALLALLAVLSLAVGSRSLGLAEAWEGLLAHDRSVASVIVWQLRLPRTVLALVAGASLAVAGVLMQALTRNPLADPGMLGVNAGAALAVVTSISLLGVTGVSGYLWFAFAGAGAASALVALMARRGADAGPTRLVLAGVALGASLHAVTGTVTMYDTDAFSSYRFWVVGSLEGRDASLITWVAPFLLVGLVMAMLSGQVLNALALGEEQAMALGAGPARARLLALTAITLLTGASTAAIGPVLFIGLVVPQLARLALGADQRRLLSLSLVLGPVLLLAADVLGRVIIRPSEMEAGVVTSFIGGPVLLAMVLRRRSTWTGAGA